MTEQHMPGALLEQEAEAVRAALAELAPEDVPALAVVFDRMQEGTSLLEALELPLEIVDLLYAQAFAAFDADRVVAALAQFQALCLLAPRNTDHWLGLGICLRRIDQAQAALLAFDTALALDPTSAAAHFYRLDLAANLQDWARARTELAAFDALPDTPAKRNLVAETQRLRTLVDVRAN